MRIWQHQIETDIIRCVTRIITGLHPPNVHGF
jgi:hypothetical protein